MLATFLLIAAQAMTFTADRVAADNMTHAVAASGNVVAVSAPYTLRGESMSRAADGTYLFSDPTYATTCTNAYGHTHWNVTGEIEYRAGDFVLLRNMWLTFWEVPVLWLPYMYYPLDTKCGFSWMPGYMSRWGAYLLTRYRYGLYDDPTNGVRVAGATRLDLRSKQGLAVGEDLDWKLGTFGSGRFTAYYAWDQDVDGNSRYTSRHHQNWGSSVDENRYAFSLSHRVEPTERDAVWARATVLSDSYFQTDFCRRTPFNAKSQFLSYPNSGVFWEHLENAYSFGAEASGRLNDFYGMTGRLPEFYFDVNPMPFPGLPVNYESANRIGYLTRDYAEYGAKGLLNPFSVRPGRWAEYEAVRLDTYHRFTLPFKTCDDVLSVVPRLAFRGTGWSHSGADNLDGWAQTGDEGELFRSILEGGVTFAGRGAGWVDDRWRHMVEPYLDVLAQKAWHDGPGDRPYVFDNLDASVMWEDQFAGRGRNLPYTYLGVTPGVRNVWERLDDRGRLEPVLDLDVYAVFQFNDSDDVDPRNRHRLAKVGRPNCGHDEARVVPGFRARWKPADDISLSARLECDAEGDIPLADAAFSQALSSDFRWNVKYARRDYRLCDFSFVPYLPYDPATRSGMLSDDMNYARMEFAEVGLEHHPADWLAWGPFIRWDVRENEVDTVGSWLDLLTDCLGFRFIVEYENSYRRIDGHERRDDWNFGFYIYLRAFGADNASLFR